MDECSRKEKSCTKRSSEGEILFFDEAAFSQRRHKSVDSRAEHDLLLVPGFSRADVGVDRIREFFDLCLETSKIIFHRKFLAHAILKGVHE